MPRDSAKMLYKTCLRIERIPQERITDAAFWSLLLSLWTTESEYNRVEIIYDALLPWLAGGRNSLGEARNGERLLSQAFIETYSDPAADWRSPQCSNTSATKSVVEAMRYVLRKRGMSRDQTKQLIFCLRRSFVQKAGKDLFKEQSGSWSEELILRASLCGLTEGSRNPSRGAPLPVVDVKVLTMGCLHLCYVAAKESEAGRISNLMLRRVKECVEVVQAMVSASPQQEGLDGLPPVLKAEMCSPNKGFLGFHLLTETNVDKYIGEQFTPTPPPNTDILSIPPLVESAAQALSAVEQCILICDELLARSQDSSTSSRLSIHLQVICIITQLFTEVLPLPQTFDKPCIYRDRHFFSRGAQLNFLEKLYKLTYTYASIWQSVERPTRSADSQRALVAGCIICIFDAVLRFVAEHNPLDVSVLMAEDGGYMQHLGVCTNNRSFEEVCATMELVNPVHATTRNAMLSYLNFLKLTTSNQLFAYRHPDKIEIKKYGGTVTFMCKLLERSNTEIHSGGSSEMQSLMNWLLGSEITSKHPEFALWRDMALLFKFLATMDTLEMEQLRMRQALRQNQSFHISFEDAGGRRGGSGWNVQAEPIKWEVVNYRGVDIDTADVKAIAFGTREINFGEGPVVQSPADVAKILRVPLPTEDDVLHTDDLPTFGDTLSREESELLMSYLTVDYMRIPLVLGFFASRDRVMYLYNPQLRDMLRAVIFEPGPWVPQVDHEAISQVPARLSALQSKQNILKRLMSATAPKDINTLGTPDGLLLNELRYACSASLDPLLSMLHVITDLADASLRSTDAGFILFMMQLAIDVDHYITYVISTSSMINASHPLPPAAIASLEMYHKRLHDMLMGTCKGILAHWNSEADADTDIESACVVRAYIALLYSSLRPNELTLDVIVDFLGSIAYVRNWHGFGMGQNRSDLLWASTDGGSDPEARMMRFLQAYGIDTTKMDRTVVDQFLKDPSRAVFLHIDNRVIRAPRIVKIKEPGTEGEGIDIEKLPPADVPEERLFSLLQIHRRRLVAWLEAAPTGTVDLALQHVVRLALKNPQFEYSGWTHSGRGKFEASRAEISFDAQMAEFLWRNDELRPVPDSMTQFSDFETLFGREALHCGMVARSNHRLWVHIVGTDYDLQQWDVAGTGDQGTGCPMPASGIASDVCEICGRTGRCWKCPTCTVSNCGTSMDPGTPCSVCGTPKSGGSSSQNENENETSEGGDEEEEIPHLPPIRYNSVLYNRVWDHTTAAQPPPETPPTEQWFGFVLAPILRTLGPIRYEFLLPQEILSREARFAHLLCCPNYGKPQATWKEITISRNTGGIYVYNLQDWGRRLYRSLVYSSKCSLSLHSMAPEAIARAQAGVPESACTAAGNWKQGRKVGESLVITRRNTKLGGRETYIPPRLLQGVVPGALLEAYHMWQGEDSVIRGEPIDPQSQWFGYSVEITINNDKTAKIIRRTAGSYTPIKTNAPIFASSLLRYTRTVNTTTNNGLTQLMNMGFSAAVCKLALRHCSNNTEAAAAWLLDDSNMMEIAGAMSTDDRPSTQQGLLPLLEEEGFGHNSSVYAMNLFGGDLAHARSWLLDDCNKEVIASLETTQKPKLASEPVAASPTTQPQAVSRVGELELFNLLDSEPGTMLHRLVQLLSRIEDASHILVWGVPGDLRQSARTDRNFVKISAVELPRIKVKFQPMQDDDGVVRLFLLDHAGWFVSDTATEGHMAGSGFIQKLLGGIENCLLLENQCREFRVMVANHDLYRPQIFGRPFSTRLVCDRGSLGWTGVMDMRYFLYPVHTSKTFLLTPSLSSLLYLILLRVLNREYATAFRLIEGCYVDTTFTADERWIFSQFERTMDDRHPDAHAIRLKLSLAIMHSDNRVPWEVHQEMDKYLSKLDHVSSGCKIIPEEEIDLMLHCKQATARLRNRLEFLTAMLRHRNSADPSALPPTVTLKPEPPKVGGQPWLKMSTLTPMYLDHHGQRLTNLKFKLPRGLRVLSDEALISMIWKQDIMIDQESGTNKNLGFLFLYEILRGQINIRFKGDEISQSFGELYSRCFHLKLSRWGRETVEEGEVESSSSAQMAALAALSWGKLSTDPNVSLPQVPVDDRTTHMLGEGINIYSAAARGTPIKTFMERLYSDLTNVLVSKRAIQDSTQAALGIVRTSILTSNTLRVPANPPPPVISALLDTSCSVRTLHTSSFTGTDLSCFASAPLGLPQLQEYVLLSETPETALASLPFDLTFHGTSHTVVAQDILKRMNDDTVLYAAGTSKQRTPYIIHMSPLEIEQFVANPRIPNFAQAIESLNSLIAKLHALQQADSNIVERTITEIIQAANNVVLDASGEMTEEQARRYRFVMRRTAGYLQQINMLFASATLLSQHAEEDLRQLNPYIEAPDHILDKVSSVMLYCSRVSQANRAIMQATSLRTLMQHISKRRPGFFTSGSNANLLTRSFMTGPDPVVVERINNFASTLAETLLCRRFFISNEDSETHNRTVDPRFMVFEYLFDFILRRRQVEMVQSFIAKARAGDSSVQQMIMGAGKTTVVGPLLCLILADGDTLVSQVMPTALLEQTRNVLRSCFNTIVVKHVFTLQFERGVDDSRELVSTLFSKLDRTRKQRGVICASPESIKSLMLKFVEQLHAIEQVNINSLTPTGSQRTTVESVRMRDQLLARSDMADELVKILDMWKRGVLIMDEVDVLLHPLRSELNFPIGHKDAIDMSGHRWDLPIHLIDAIFFATTGRSSCDVQTFSKQAAALKVDPAALLKSISVAVSQGFDAHKMQHQPHLVLLDQDWYHGSLKPLLAQWALLWLYDRFVGAVTVPSEILYSYITGENPDTHRTKIEEGLLPESKKLLNLTRNWLLHLFPHVLAKINRVTFGLLTPADMLNIDPRTPQSRLLMAVPFVGKDVPSRSSEFAHPDAVIGLTILAYRYEGVRQSDLMRVMSQLKQDFARQVGPREQRPASTMFKNWLALARETASAAVVAASSSILPLALFQPNDPKQMTQLYALVRRLPQLIHYYLCQHVFPACMNFQLLKVSACGHELGSNLLFGRRIGFSGTPSNLLPLDLGECQYEPGSDGKILNVLTSPNVVSASLKTDWTAKSLLRDICQADPPFLALIDTGALITGMDNEEVAHFMLQLLPDWMEGFVYLDRADRQMVLLRSGQSVKLSECGISPSRRFTFYDQVHTTGMDIKQASNARAVVTIGKDMTFRDYAQGCYRMRGIGKGMCIHVFVIQEVLNKLAQDLGTHQTNRPELDIPAWLLLNSMRMESLQFVKMGQQELQNIFRKKALSTLLDESRAHYSEAPMYRLRRFHDAPPPLNEFLRTCVQHFREVIDYTIENAVPKPHRYIEKIQEDVVKQEPLSIEAPSRDRVNSVLKNLGQVTAQQESERMGPTESDLGLNAEVVHEQEAQAQEEAEEEAEEEQQKISAFTRDDESHIPWNASLLTEIPSGELKGGEPFYKFKHFHVREQQPKLKFPESMMLSDNFFRPRWVGVGDRRLKNVAVFLEWAPVMSSEIARVRTPLLMKQISTGCGNTSCKTPTCRSNPQMKPLDPSDTPAKLAVQLALQTSAVADPKRHLPLFCPSTIEAMIQPEFSTSLAKTSNRFVVALSLAEAETIRKIIHSEQTLITKAALALHTIDGLLMDNTPNYIPELSGELGLVGMALQSLRFFNCEMYFSDEELDALEHSLAASGLTDRLQFFTECLRLRRRQRNLWGDTPLAKFFSPREEWKNLRARAIAEQISIAIKAALHDKKQHLDPYQMFEHFDDDHDGKLSYAQLDHLFDWMRLGFAPGDYHEIVKILDTANTGTVSQRDFITTFGIPSHDEVLAIEAEKQINNVPAEPKQTGRWRCSNCTYMNSPLETTCCMCEVGWSGERECPRDKWMCPPERGGCTFFNPVSQFYCEMCNRARPDLISHRLV
ncbi:nxn protein [Pelomyxa schiedti]|nr:nxn protein [Pelomyxa schiedti]